MSCPSCGNSEYYCGMIGHNCPNPNCNLPGNKKASSATSIPEDSPKKGLLPASKYPGFFWWIDGAPAENSEMTPLCRGRIIVIQHEEHGEWFAGDYDDYDKGCLLDYATGWTPEEAYQNYKRMIE